MSGKNQFPTVFDWQTTDPSLTFLPTPYQAGSTPSGNSNGTMTGTTVIYSNIIDVSKMDNIGLEVDWTGTPTGTFEVMFSNKGKSFKSVTFDPVLAQPTGAAGGMGVDLNQYPWKYIMLRYTNASGTGTLTVTGQQKDLN